LPTKIAAKKFSARSHESCKSLLVDIRWAKNNYERCIFDTRNSWRTLVCILLNTVLHESLGLQKPAADVQALLRVVARTFLAK